MTAYTAEELVLMAKRYLCGDQNVTDDILVERIKLKSPVLTVISDTRVRNALIRYSPYLTVDDVLRMSKRQISGVYNLGSKGRKRLVYELGLNGFDAKHLLQEVD